MLSYLPVHAQQASAEVGTGTVLFLRAVETTVFTKCLWQFLSVIVRSSVSAQGNWCSEVDCEVTSPKCTFFTSGISVSLQPTDGKLLLCQMWTLTIFNSNSRCWSLLQLNTCWEWVTKFTSYILSSFFGDLACNKPCSFFSTAGAWRSLPAVCCASILKGAHSTDEVWSVSQAIKESVSRKMEKPNWDWKHSLPVYLPYVSSWLIL